MNDTPQTTEAPFYAAVAAAAGLRTGRSRTVAGLLALVLVLVAFLGASLVTTAALVKKPREIHHTILVDRVTGEARQLTAGDGIRTASEDEFVKEGLLARYVILRERYLWQTVEADSILVGLHSAPSVERAYDEWVRGPSAPTAQYENSKIISVSIDSVDAGQRGDVGRVRFTRRTRDADDPPGEGVVTRHTATIGYEFVIGAAMYGDDRLQNPLAFQVTAYDVVGDTANREVTS